MGEGCGVAESAVASTVLPVHIIAALPNTIILVVADAGFAVKVHTGIHIRVPLLANLVEIGSIRDRLAIIDIFL